MRIGVVVVILAIVSPACGNDPVRPGNQGGAGGDNQGGASGVAFGGADGGAGAGGSLGAGGYGGVGGQTADGGLFCPYTAQCSSAMGVCSFATAVDSLKADCHDAAWCDVTSSASSPYSTVSVRMVDVTYTYYYDGNGALVAEVRSGLNNSLTCIEGPPNFDPYRRM